jgi:septum formation protein
MTIRSLDKYQLILASKSPRRQQMLRELGLKFEVAELDYEEIIPENLNGEESALFLAREKANPFRHRVSGNEIVITADTIVWCNGKALGKPADYADAVNMLNELSGNTHEVITGVNLLSSWKEVSFSECTKVTFEKLTDEEIAYYIEEFKPYDKAGAYGIQEWIGLAACTKIDGSYFNVVGLPVQKLYKELQNFIK